MANRGKPIRLKRLVADNKIRENQSKAILDYQIKALKLPEMIDEFRFHPSRRWRFDRANPQVMIAIEIEGGIWSGGRHIRGIGFSMDCEKYNDALAMGWRVIRVTPAMVKNGKAVAWYESLLRLRKIMKTGDLPSPVLIDVIDPLPSSFIEETMAKVSAAAPIREQIGPKPPPLPPVDQEVPLRADDLTPAQVLALFPSRRKRQQSE